MERKENEYYPRNRAAWRKWLEKNHSKALYVWLILYRKESGIPSLVYAEVVEEALCFGWIDSKPNKRNEESYFLFIAPRKPKSPWSALNKRRVEKLLKENRITPAGLTKIEAAKKDGSWSALDKVEALTMPMELKKVFTKNKKAFANFDLFPGSVKKQLLYWVESAKTETTRRKRITEIVTKAEKNIRANQWKPKK